MNDNQSGKKPGDPLNRRNQALQWWRYLAWFIALLIFTWYFWTPPEGDRMTLSYSDFKASVIDDQVARVQMQGDSVTGEFHQPRTPETGAGDPKTRFVTTMPPVPDP